MRSGAVGNSCAVFNIARTAHATLLNGTVVLCLNEMGICSREKKKSHRSAGPASSILKAGTMLL